ncbi:MAG: tRNA (cytidine(34)-2'-O)-methyltransferase [Phycisphaerales bacterium]|nr:tRNA (cytidine(34)-2'-O)-methyltransferase [Phycisphaerales bacterium]
MNPKFNIVLSCPQIPNNTGNIGRTAMASGCRLHLIHPLSFDLSQKAVRRAGMDYWHNVDLKEHQDWESFIDTEKPERLWLFTTKSDQTYWSADFQRGDYLLFGSEQHGVPLEVHNWVTENIGEEARLCLPMEQQARSLNLATAVCTAVYEGLRQLSL